MKVSKLLLFATVCCAATGALAADPAASSPMSPPMPPKPASATKPPPVSVPSAPHMDKAADKKPAAKAGALPPDAVRSWDDVDTNKDGSISADEMEAYLKSHPGGQKGD